jgi:hypothetical protein
MLLLRKEAHPNRKSCSMWRSTTRSSSCPPSITRLGDHRFSSRSAWGILSITILSGRTDLEQQQALEQMALFKLEMEKNASESKRTQDQIEGT